MENYVKKLRSVLDSLETAVGDRDWDAVEEAIDELRSIIDELEEAA